MPFACPVCDFVGLDVQPHGGQRLVAHLVDAVGDEGDQRDPERAGDGVQGVEGGVAAARLELGERGLADPGGGGEGAERQAALLAHGPDARAGGGARPRVTRHGLSP